MSDYRVFDKTKNQYDATVMSSLFVDDVPKGFDIALSIDKVTSELVSNTYYYYNTEATLTFTSFRQNPSGGIYTWTNDFGLEGTVNGYNVNSRRILYYDVKWEDEPTLSFKLRLKNETPFSFRIYNVNTNGESASSTSSFPEEGEQEESGLVNAKVNIVYEQGYTPENLLNINTIVEGNQEKVLETRISFTDYELTSMSLGTARTDIGMYLSYFSLQRIF